MSFLISMTSSHNGHTEKNISDNLSKNQSVPSYKKFTAKWLDKSVDVPTSRRKHITTENGRLIMNLHTKSTDTHQYLHKKVVTHYTAKEAYLTVRLSIHTLNLLAI